MITHVASSTNQLAQATHQMEFYVLISRIEKACIRVIAFT